MVASSIKERNILAYQHCVSIYDRVAAICEPLFNLGIPHFDYGRFFDNGSYLPFFTSKIDFAKVYLETITNRGEILTDQMQEFCNKK